MNVSERSGYLYQMHQIASLTNYGMDRQAATELTLALHDRPTRDQVLLWIEQAESRIYRRLIPLWLPHLGALIAIMWKVFGG